MFDQWGIPTDKQNDLEKTMIEKASIYDDVSVTPISDGATISAGETEMRVVVTPGHTAGHVSLELPGGGILTGDALLPQ